ncbi:hypothetical protein OG585_52160 (plasmid) [Streptomyces sp. NBC_01340]|nr:MULTISPECIES: hypothetical protein [unclassified Streptomyces]MCX4460340.1 hypothetical protein [Streptomyces sp. NBC_01719]MCX4500330.1 hypothetical protein [Streptomyces sp. NBC_01728]WSI45387.1 hypothetical protein OG585_52160 [Streptomyces sp. NBC_01340]
MTVSEASTLAFGATGALGRHAGKTGVEELRRALVAALHGASR